MDTGTDVRKRKVAKKKEATTMVFKQDDRYVLVFRTPDGQQIGFVSDFVGK